MSKIHQIRKWHKRLMLIVGLQCVIWALTGLYMVTIDIHFIHGESLIKSQHATIEHSQVDLSFSDIYQRFPEAKAISLVSLLGRNVYRFRDGSAQNHYRLVDADNGELLNEISKQQAIAIANHEKTFDADIASVTLFDEQAPSEVSPRYLPMWQVTFDKLSAPTFYISQQSGQIVTTRHLFWNTFDWMWRFHITDYDDGENVQNGFLIALSSITLVSVILGFILSIQRIVLTNRKRRA